MTTPAPPSWFIEHFQPTGSAIGFRVRGKLEQVQSPFQHIEIFDSTDWGHIMVIDGALMLTARDNFLYHEMIAHPVLFTHPNPQQVVIIGGGDCGSLHEVLKHASVERVIQCDIDEQVTRLSERYFPELCQSNNDPRAELHFADGIAWMAACAPASVDVIMIDSTDPVGPAEGLFNADFYRQCFRALKADGLLVQQSESPLVQLELIQAMRAEMTQAGFACFQTLPFPQPCYPSGWWSVTIAAKTPAVDFNFRHESAASKAFTTRYYTDEIHRAAQAMPPFMAAALQG